VKRPVSLQTDFGSRLRAPILAASPLSVPRQSLGFEEVLSNVPPNCAELGSPRYHSRPGQFVPKPLRARAPPAGSCDSLGDATADVAQEVLKTLSATCTQKQVQMRCEHGLLVDLDSEPPSGPFEFLRDRGLVCFSSQRPWPSSTRRSEGDMHRFATGEGSSTFAFAATDVAPVLQSRSRNARKQQLSQRRHGQSIIATESVACNGAFWRNETDFRSTKRERVGVA
jgi:hypothetical protein